MSLEAKNACLIADVRFSSTVNTSRDEFYDPLDIKHHEYMDGDATSCEYRCATCLVRLHLSIPSATVESLGVARIHKPEPGEVGFCQEAFGAVELEKLERDFPAKHLD